MLLLAKTGIENLLQIGDFSHPKLIPMFKEVASCIPHQGNFILQWKDNWQGPPLDIQFPELHSYVLDNQITVQSMLSEENVIHNLHTPISTQAHTQVLSLQQRHWIIETFHQITC